MKSAKEQADQLGSKIERLFYGVLLLGLPAVSVPYGWLAFVPALVTYAILRYVEIRGNQRGQVSLILRFDLI